MAGLKFREGLKAAREWVYVPPIALVPFVAAGAVTGLYAVFYFLVFGCHGQGWRAFVCAPSKIVADGARRVGFAEVAARLTWSASALLLTTIAAGAVVVALCLLYRSADKLDRYRRPALLVGSVLLALGGAGLGAWAARDYVLFRNLFDGAHLFDPVERAFAGAAAGWLRALTYFAATLVILAACSTLADRSAPGNRPQRGVKRVVSPAEIEGLRTRLKRLNLVLYTGAALLVAAVLEFSAFQAWPVARMAEAAAKGVAPAATAAVAAVGGIAFVVLVALYVPALMILHVTADDLYDEATTTDPRDKWLQDNGLAVSLPKSATRFAAVLAPLLAAGPFSALLKILVTG